MIYNEVQFGNILCMCLRDTRITFSTDIQGVVVSASYCDSKERYKPIVWLAERQPSWIQLESLTTLNIPSWNSAPVGSMRKQHQDQQPNNNYTQIINIMPNENETRHLSFEKSVAVLVGLRVISCCQTSTPLLTPIILTSGFFVRL